MNFWAMTGQRRWGWAFALLICVSSAFGETAKSQDKPITENYPTGEMRFSYTVDAQGERHGNFHEYYTNGKTKVDAHYLHGRLAGDYTQYNEAGKVRVRSKYADGKLDGKLESMNDAGKVVLRENYRKGLLNGIRETYDDKGRLDGETVWLGGRLLVPVGERLLRQWRKDITAWPIATINKESVPDIGREYLHDDPGTQSQREQAIRRLMTYRMVAGLAWKDLVLDQQLNAINDAGAELFKATTWSHFPPNPGWPAAKYDYAKQGPASSNICSMHNMIGQVDMFMDDSDVKNRDRVGHRRWCLNPTMLKTGFAADSGGSLMWSMDKSRDNFPDYDLIAWPARGLQPTDLFQSREVWHVSFNRDHFRVPDNSAAIKVHVYPAQLDMNGGQVVKTGPELPLDYFHVDHGGFGRDGHAVIFHPKGADVQPGKNYLVEVEGIEPINQDGTTSYVVIFMR